MIPLAPRSRKAAAAAAALALTASIGGCAVNATPPSDSGSSAATDSAGYRTQFEELLPALIAEADAGLDVEKLREESCLAPEVEEQQTETNWVGKAGGPVADSAGANAALDRIGSWLDSGGWEKQNEVSYPPEEGGEVRSLVYSKDDVGLTATYFDSTSPAVEIILGTPCVKNPAGHRMQRSGLDPDHGLSSRYYEDGGS